MMLQLTPLSGAVGAEVHGLDLSDGVSDALVEDLQSALARYRMIAVRDQLLSVSDFSRLARRFGPFSGNPIHVPLDGFEDVVKGVREADDTGPNLGGQWHMDLAWFEAPPALTLLYAEETPPAGGDTLFADLRSAFGALSPGMQALTSDLVSVHSARNVYATNAAVRAVDVQADARATSQVETEHPLVCRHPLTDRPHLFVSSTIRRFKGMTEEESRPIVDFLLQHAVRPEFTCRLRWDKGTLAIWENTCLLHRAINDYTGHRRVIYRTTVAGTRPRPAADTSRPDMTTRTG